MFVNGEHCVEDQLTCPRSLTPHDCRESKPQEIDAYVAEGKVPVDVDLSQHPEKSIEARGCMFLMLFTATSLKIHVVRRAHGKGCCVNQRYQDRSRDVSCVISCHSPPA